MNKELRKKLHKKPFEWNSYFGVILCNYRKIKTKDNYETDKIMKRFVKQLNQDFKNTGVSQ